MTTTLIIAPNSVNIMVEVAFDYQPAEPMSSDREYPGCKASVQISKIFHDGLDITDYLSEEVISQIELTILRNGNDRRY